ncbi:ABC transporter substrate-binding protein [Sneathiella sp. P13V-1]|uniref:ABC transporter substrate-binding protein n=1 Tax=Sneathiella sp. P13V-1 TaxID=2697366 RepID=UPI00187B5D3D|nr:ABC transporter substrate-binding protein [Sneathiella sp. P13V-1]MBE7637086.1 ABC transporter substrate-binding protein [Sneathiella sp. P13V-1]
MSFYRKYLKNGLKVGLSVVAVGGSVLVWNAGKSAAFERVDGEKILVVAGRQSVETLDPSIKYNASIRTMQQALYDGLVKYEGSPANVVPWLAQSWESNADGTRWTFTLNSKAKFHNGDPVTAEAVNYSFARTLELGKGPSWMLADFLKPEGIRVVDEKTIEFNLEKPYAAFLSFLPWWYVMNPAQVEANAVEGDRGQKWLTSNAAGSGPYMLKRFEQGRLYELTRVKDYWHQDASKSNIGGVIYKLVRETSAQRAALMKGEADIVLNLSPDEFKQVQKAKGIVTSTEPALTSFGLKFNTQGKHMADRNLRKAVAHAFDYNALVTLFNGNAVLQTSPFTDDIKGKISVPAIPRQDFAKAKDYLSKSAFPDGGIELEYVYVQGFEVTRQMGLVLLDNLKKLNINLKLVPLTWPNIVARGSKPETAADITAIFTTPVSTDPDAVAYQYHPKSWGRYYGVHFYDNAKVKGLIEQARFTTKWEDRAPLYEEIQKIIVDDQPEIFGMMRNRQVAYRDYVKGFSYSPVRMTTEIDLYGLRIE